MIYFDHAATTIIEERVIEKMNNIQSLVYGNPSSLHKKGREAKFYVDEARESIANAVGAKDSEIIFTSGGTESNNLAILGSVLALKDRGKHIITSKQEHPAVLNVMSFLESIGFNVTYLDSEVSGKVDLAQVKSIVQEDTILVSVMYVNNETGVIQPIKEIGQFLQEKEILFHVDAVQALSTFNIDVTELNVDLLTFTSHKLGGPKGIGALYKKEGIQLKPTMYGGDQEHQLRAGTENVVSIVGFAEAISLLEANRHDYNKTVKEVTNLLINQLEEAQIPFEINGNVEDKVNSIINIYFPWVKNDILLANLDLENIAISSGSACTAGTLEPSHVLLSMYDDKERANQSVRFSFSHKNSEAEVKKTVNVLKKIYEKLS